MNLTQILPFAAPLGIAAKDIWKLRLMLLSIE